METNIPRLYKTTILEQRFIYDLLFYDLLFYDLLFYNLFCYLAIYLFVLTCLKEKFAIFPQIFSMKVTHLSNSLPAP